VNIFRKKLNCDISIAIAAFRLSMITVNA